MHAGKWVAALLLSVLTGPVSPVLAQSLKDLIQVNKSAGFATGFAPTDAARYEALPEAPPGSDADKIARGLMRAH